MIPHTLQNFNPEQRAAVEAPHDPLLIVAGAGTGKTRTLVGRILHLLEGGVAPERIYAVTFTNKAAKEMADRVSRGIKDAKRGTPFIGTFHSLGARILRKECRRIGRTVDFTIFDEQDSFHALKKAFGRLPENAGMKKARRATDREDRRGPAFFRELVSRAKNGMASGSHERGLSTEDKARFEKIYKLYEEELRENNAFDFDDLIEKPVALFSEHADIHSAYASGIEHLLVDEYQDINNAQYAFIRLLVGEKARITVVGDDQQTIYTWRGSNVETFRNFEADWPMARVLLLEENYRSSGNIIRAASAVVANNTRDRKKQLWTKNPEGDLVTLVECGSPEDEAAYVAEQIASHPPGVPAGTIGILYRTNAQSRAIEQALLGRRIPYVVYGGLKFYERREVRDVVAAMRYAANPHDSVSRDRLEKTFSKTAFRTIDDALRGTSESAPVAVANAFLRAANYFDYMDRTLTHPGEREENIAALLAFAAQFDRLTPFLERVTLLQATDTVSDHDRRVTLLTMHLAKGLEFDEVFVVGASEGLLPHARSLGNLDELEEERRLMYVAMTRAKRKLTVSFYDIPSRFIGEIPAELTVFHDLVSDERSFDDSEERYITLD